MKNKKNEPGINAADKENAAMKTDTNMSVSEDDIRKRAFEISFERGNLYAPPEADWLKAEAELRKPHTKRNGRKIFNYQFINIINLIEIQNY